MKKLLFLLLFVSNFAFAQDFEYTYKVQAGTWNKYQEKWDWDPVKDQEIKIKLDGSKVYIYNNANTVITTYEDLGEKSGYDDDNDAYKTHSWLAVDDKRRKCRFVMTWYSDIPLIVYTVIYNDIGFRFYIRNNKLSNFGI
jgi:hypothetical protein